MTQKIARHHEAKTRQPVKFVYFDVGNVLVRFSGGIEGLANIVQASVEDMHDFWSQRDPDLNRGSLTPKKFWRQLKKQFDYRGPDIDYVEFWVNNFSPIAETHALALRLSNDFKLGLLTNIPPGVLNRAVTLGHVPRISYAAVIESHVFRIVKPEPKIFRIAQKQAGVKPEEILFIDDNATYIDQAIRLGFNTYHFDTDNPAASVRELEQLVDLSPHVPCVTK